MPEHAVSSDLSEEVSASSCERVEFVSVSRHHGEAFDEMIEEYRAADEAGVYGGIFSVALESFEAFFTLLDRMRAGGYPEQHNVPMDAYFLKLDGRLLGEVYVRRVLSPQLLQFGGHIGYKIRPACRNRGLATQALRFGLQEIARTGIDYALLTCASSNVPSARVIEKCGGVRIGDSHPDGMTTMRRYLVPARSRSGP